MTLDKTIQATNIGYAYINYDITRVQPLIKQWEKNYNDIWFSYYLKNMNKPMKEARKE